ncbi:hypothetical protein ScPMuIL_007686 [Solemya velum]
MAFWGNVACSLLFVSCVVLLSCDARYDPNWGSLDKRPLPQWYDEAKLGIFIHWGVFSVPSFSSEWFWWDWQGKPLPGVVAFMEKNYRPGFTYADFAEDFTTEFFNPDRWADLFAAAGAKYVVLTSKHHEGFTNWPSKVSFNWNSMDNGPKRDLVGMLADSVKNRTDLHFGLYHSLFEWFHPLYLQDKSRNFTTRDFVKMKTMPELMEIVNAYHPEVIWSDGDWEAPAEYWQSQEFLAWLYNDSPVNNTVVTNDRWGNNISCHHGGFYTCGDRFNPGTLQPHKWENAMTIDKYSWGYRRNAQLSDYLTIEELLATFVSTVSCNGNMLMNVGPTKYGTIPPVFEERLRQLGQWMSVNGEAIYSSKPWTHQNDTVTEGVWYTMKPGPVVYATVLTWPGSNLTLGAPTSTSATVISLLGFPGNLNWKPASPSGVIINIPPIPINKMPCKWAWVFKMEGLSN